MLRCHKADTLRFEKAICNQPNLLELQELQGGVMRVGIIVSVVLLSAAHGAVAAEGEPKGHELRKIVSGRTIELNTPLGGLPISYRMDGTMRGKAESLAAYTGSSHDSGIWWIAANKLCQRWQKWLDGKSYCFTLQQQGRAVQWTRNDGLTGTATIRR
jgi:hypothetical protein